MRLGFSLPQYGQVAREGARLGEFAAEAERLGAHGLWVGDRLIAPVAPTVGYGGRDTIPEQFRTGLDPFTALTVAATTTRTVRLGTSVLVAPWYPPVQLARQLTGIDVVSGGRLTAGFGIGWSPEEFQAAGAPWRGRGAQLDEALDALVTLWTADPAEHRGRRWTVPAAHVSLKPVRRPHPPIFLGGVSAAALDRIGRRADGWLPVVRVPGPDPVAGLRRQRAATDAASERAGREPGAIDTVVRVNVAAGTDLDQVAAVLDRLADAGYPEAFVDPLYLATSVDEHLGVVKRLLGGFA